MAETHAVVGYLSMNKYSWLLINLRMVPIYLVYTIQSVSGGIISILGSGSMDYSELQQQARS